MIRDASALAPVLVQVGSGSWLGLGLGLGFCPAPVLPEAGPLFIVVEEHKHRRPGVILGNVLLTYI